MINSQDIWNRLDQIRTSKPLILSITNIVVTNITANMLLALGASPAMAVSGDEIEELASLSSALVLNMGTPSVSQIKTMNLAATRARELEVPVVLDPVGAGASRMRTRAPLDLLDKGLVSILRGNASEIMALGGEAGKPRGVDSLHGSDQAVEAAAGLSNKYGCVVCVSGEQDFIVSGNQVGKVLNGHPMMTLVTGMGCSSTCLVAAFSAVEKDYFKASLMGMGIMGICGEEAAGQVRGPGSLESAFLDMLYNLDSQSLQGIRMG